MTPAAAGPLETIRKAYEAAYAQGDASALADLYTPDAVIMPPEEGAGGVGADAVKSYFQPQFDHFTTRLSISLDESAVLGDWTFARGGYTAQLTPKAHGDTVQIRGTWLAIYAPQGNGSLKLARHIWNTPTPMVFGR